jgi:hypothetical protein
MAFHEDGVDPGSRWGRERLSGPNWVMESMWARLPSEVLKRVVTFLPLAPLVRFKAVSRKWNRLISHREFVSRHAQAASPEEYVLVTVRFDAYESNPVRGWEVLDVANRRFFTLSSDFLTEYVKWGGIVPPSKESYNERALLAADGGLFCVSYSFNEQSSVLLVCNPILKTVKRLPQLKGWVASHQRVVMRTDRVSMEYEVYIVHDPLHRSFKPKTILIYESKTGRWRTVPNIPPLRNELDFYMKPWCSVSKFLKNEFFEPFQHGHHPTRAGIVAFDKATGVLSDLGVALPAYLGEATNLQLVVSNARLFCVARSYPEFSCEEIFEIFEIVMERKGQQRRKSVRLATMPSDLLSLVLGDELLHDPFVAVGCGNSILICSVTGWSVAYDLTKKAWDQYPHNKLWKALKLFGEPHQEVCGSNYCLSLCAP